MTPGDSTVVSFKCGAFVAGLLTLAAGEPTFRYHLVLVKVGGSPICDLGAPYITPRLGHIDFSV